MSYRGRPGRQAIATRLSLLAFVFGAVQKGLTMIC